MNKTLTKKLIYVIAVIAMLAMLIPATAVPVSAAPSLTMVLVDPLTGVPNTTPDSGYNVTGAKVRITSNIPVTMWANQDILGTSTVTANTSLYEEITGVVGETLISADGSPTVDKKWGNISSTVITPTGSSYVTWNEGTKSWSGSANITDTVWGNFPTGVPNPHLAQGAILNWYLVDSGVTVPMAAGEAAPNHMYNTAGLTKIMAGLTPARFSTIAGTSPAGTMTRTVSGADGTSTITINTTGEEAIQIVVVPEYPGDPQILTTPEVTSWNFMTREMEVVPQVRWAGEKIVLEKNFGQAAGTTYAVKFSLENQSPGALTATGPGPVGYNYGNTTQTVWSYIDSNGMASVILECDDQGQCAVDASLYLISGVPAPVLENEHSFVVYYLKFESLTLHDVIGKRNGTNPTSHQAGPWTITSTTTNPWDPTQDWEVLHPGTPEPINVSQDALLRANVKGWFTNSNPTTRPAATVDIGGTYPLALPLGRWVLPDDWPNLAGLTNWTERRIHWDIMSAPNDGKVFATNPLGNYYKTTTTNIVATAPVIGPFSPGIEMMTNTGWADPNKFGTPAAYYDATNRAMQTVVPNGNLDWWDAPMPPAKIIYEINSGPGFFKDALKSDIYYVVVGGITLYTNPFYQEMIPAHEYIPPFANNGGYDWASFGTPGNGSAPKYGAYTFWTVINQPGGIVTPQDAAHPTKVEVYSDNHGEAMVYLNGNANLNLPGNNAGADIVFGSTVGTTVAQAMADYPYFRLHEAIFSNTVTKNWTWAGQILGPTGQSGGASEVLVAGSDSPNAADYITLTAGTGYTDPAAQGTSNKHVIWIWATDRDGMQSGVIDTRVSWTITGADTFFFDNAGIDFTGINPNPNSNALVFDGNGFLKNVNHAAVRAVGTTVNTGVSWLRAPLAAEIAIFHKFYPSLDANNFAVSAIDILSNSAGTVHVAETLTGSDYSYTDTTGVFHPIGTITRHTDFVTTQPYPLDDQILLGDANLDKAINMMDVTAVERIILGMDKVRSVQADANYSGTIDMGDVIRIEKIYLGLQ